MNAYVDEVGCASIFGPVMVCAVAIDKNVCRIDGVRDSKKLTKKKREELYPILEKNIDHAFGAASVRKVEEINLHWAKYNAMKDAVEKLVNRGIKIDKVIVDGKFEIPNLDIPQEAIIKADDKFWEVGAASVLAKVKRDRLITKFSTIEKYSYYDLSNNAGYYSPNHRVGIILHGPTSFHRRHFAYFKYCLAEHKKCQEFIKRGQTPEDYLEWVIQNKKSGKSIYLDWQEEQSNKWGDIKCGG